jgi:cation transport ATPase
MSTEATRAQQEETRAFRLEVVLTGLTGVGLVLGALLQLAEVSPVWVYLAFGLSFLAGGLPPLWQALQSLRRGKVDIDLLMVPSCSFYLAFRARSRTTPLAIPNAPSLP